MFQIQFEHSFHPVPMGVISLLSSSITHPNSRPASLSRFREPREWRREERTQNIGFGVIRYLWEKMALRLSLWWLNFSKFILTSALLSQGNLKTYTSSYGLRRLRDVLVDQFSWFWLLLIVAFKTCLGDLTTWVMTDIREAISRTRMLNLRPCLFSRFSRATNQK